MLQIDNVVKSYTGHSVLRGLSLDIPSGSIYALLGANGAGKTTLLRIINGILMPDSGSVSLDGAPITLDSSSRIGYLPEERGLYRKMVLADQVIYLAMLHGMTRQQASRELDMWLERFDLTEWRKRPVENLSKGMQQKVQFISTVIHRPDLLIFDEPFSGFDPVNAELLKNEILRLNAEGATVLFSTHNLDSVSRICTHAAILHDGKIATSGPLSSILQTGQSINDLFFQIVSHQ
mgnify:CR=1 FL=1